MLVAGRNDPKIYLVNKISGKEHSSGPLWQVEWGRGWNVRHLPRTVFLSKQFRRCALLCTCSNNSSTFFHSSKKWRKRNTNRKINKEKERSNKCRPILVQGLWRDIAINFYFTNINGSIAQLIECSASVLKVPGLNPGLGEFFSLKFLLMRK